MQKLVALIVSLLVAAAPSVAAPSPMPAASCQFVLGFLTLEQMIPGQVGSCLTNVRYNPSNGDGLQSTTGPSGHGGLLVWRKSDNFTAFTDGFRSWVNGPFGLQARLNTQRFSWEWNPDNLPIVPAPVAGDRCHTAGLSLSLQTVEGGAGNFVGTFALTNNTTVSCTFYGFVGAQMLDSHNNPLPTNVVRNGGLFSREPISPLFPVPAGESAIFRMHWEDVPVGNEQSCPTSDALQITPPNEFDPILIPTHLTACDGGHLDITAISPPGVAAGGTSTNTSRNWAGYVATSGQFTGVAATWVVAQSTSNGRLTASTTWVGIGGLNSLDLIQAGTEDSNRTGSVTYDAWIELLPQPPQIVPLTVQPGDSMTVSLAQQAAGQWLISMNDNTSGKSYSATVPYVSSLSSAEWIEEAPSTRRFLLPLSNFGTVQIGDASTIQNGKSVTIAQAGARLIAMINATGNVIAQPSSLTASGTGFSITRITSLANVPSLCSWLCVPAAPGSGD